MPLYDFKCPKCNTITEHLFSTWSHMNQASKAGVVCPECGAPKCIRIITAPPQFSVHGFNAQNGYNLEKKRTFMSHGVKVTTEEH